MFSIIPVIDLMGGQVVGGKSGNRECYRPVESVLTTSCTLPAVVEAFLSVYEFRQIYIADLDAIQKNGNHFSLIRELGKAFPSLELWVDSGIESNVDFNRIADLNIGKIVVGSETFAARVSSPLPRDSILSLDYGLSGPLGSGSLCTVPEYWPEQLIVLSIDRVGKNSGPDIARLQHVRKQAASSRIFAAGGVRNNSDLVRLSNLGIRGALVSTALHRGQITCKDINAICRPA